MKKILAVILSAVMLLAAGFAAAEGVYTNESAGFAFTAPEGWEILSNEELAAILGVANDYFDDENMKAVMEQGQEMTVMMAMNMSTGSTVNLNEQILDAASALYLNAMSEVDLLQTSGAQAAAMYAQLGIEITEPEYGNLDFAGVPSKDYMAYYLSYPDQGVEMLIVQMFFRNDTDFFTLTISAITEDDLAAALTAFAAL